MATKKYMSDWYQKNKTEIKKRSKSQIMYKHGSYSARTAKHRKKSLASWEGFIPKMTQCQMCGRDIYFNQKDSSKAIHFDHRNGGKEVIKKPFAFLSDTKRTPHSEAKWKSCGFGMLCLQCNVRIPTVDRKQFAENLLKYLT